MDTKRIIEQLKQTGDVEAAKLEVPDILTARDKDGNTLLHNAVLDEEFELAKTLIENGAYPLIYNGDWVTAYSLVVRIDNAELLKLLLARYPNSLSAFDQAELLATAAVDSQEGQLRLMLEAGFDVNEKYRESSLADWALQSSRLDIIELIHSYDAPMDQPDDDGSTPLMSACAEGLIDIVEYLVRNGADVNRVATNGNTPLISACAWEQPKIVALLLKKGADIKLLNLEGRTALDIAEETGNAKIIKLLKGHA